MLNQQIQEGDLKVQSYSMAGVYAQEPARGISVSLLAGKFQIIHASKEQEQPSPMFAGKPRDIIDSINDTIIEGMCTASEQGLPLPDNFIAITSDGITYKANITDDAESNA